MNDSTQKFASAALAATAFLALLAACGGGGSDTPAVSPGPSAEGVYEGTLSGSSNSKFELLVLENDQFWALYGNQTGNNFGVNGFLQGQGTSNNGSYTSADSEDFGFAPPVSTPVSATYTTSGNISGTAGSVTLAGAPFPSTDYIYATPALASTIVGAWTLAASDGSDILMSITSSGTFAASSAGCAITGIIVPGASGKNVYDVALTIGSILCANPGMAGTGVALSYPTNTGSQQLNIVVVNSARTQGLAMFGTR